MRRLSRLAITLAIGLMMMAHSAFAWELLGTAGNEPRLERAVIEVGRDAGLINAIRMDVKRNDAEILDLRVVYRNGSTEDIKVREVFKAGTSSRRIDLAGRERYIREIVVTYMARGPVRIEFHGDVSAAARWEELGCKSVAFVLDRDVIRVGRKERFKSIRLRVEGNKIEMLDLSVIYGNGARDSIRVREFIPAGGSTKALDLKGDARGIDRIELIYRSLPNFGGKAIICVEGLQVQ